jgi:hyperosmotically inducible periplasmic protein
MNRTMLKCVLAMAAMAGTMGFAQSSPTQDSTKPDNTAVNQRDRNAAEPTADQQKETGTDREMSRKIRRSIVSDKALSTNAHNIKIISQNGMVTLKGPVNSDEEKKAVEKKATEIAGEANVKSEIQVAAGDMSSAH